MVTYHDNNFIIVGVFSGTIDLDPSLNQEFLTSTSSVCEGFYAKYDSMGNYIFGYPIHGDIQSWAESVTVNEENEIYVYGNFFGKVDMDPGPDSAILNSNAMYGYFGKYSPSGSLIWHNQIGTVGGDLESHNIYYADSKIFISGEFGSDTDFDPTSITYILNAPPVSNTQPGYGYLVRYSEIPIGLNDESSQNPISVSPNPAINRLQVIFSGNIKGGTYQVTDLFGNSFLSGEISGSMKTEIDISSMPQGTFLIRISTKSNTYYKKFIKI